jgi:hypothetical protein
MTTTSTNWKHWTTSTRVFVGLGGAFAVAVLVFLYST